MTDVSEAEVEAAGKALYLAAQDEPNWDFKRYRDVARAALTAAAQVRERARRESCTHPRKTGTGFIRSDGSSHSKWACPDCGAHNEIITPATKPVLMPIYGAAEPDQGEDVLGMRKGKE